MASFTIADLFYSVEHVWAAWLASVVGAAVLTRRLVGRQMVRVH